MKFSHFRNGGCWWIRWIHQRIVVHQSVNYMHEKSLNHLSVAVECCAYMELETNKKKSWFFIFYFCVLFQLWLHLRRLPDWLDYCEIPRNPQRFHLCLVGKLSSYFQIVLRQSRKKVICLLHRLGFLCDRSWSHDILWITFVIFNSHLVDASIVRYDAFKKERSKWQRNQEKEESYADQWIVGGGVEVDHR